jgi:hypothetical protein
MTIYLQVSFAEPLGDEWIEELAASYLATGCAQRATSGQYAGVAAVWTANLSEAKRPTTR